MQLKPKKRLGQHFLYHPAIAEKIASHVPVPENGSINVLEIGPGKGILTQFLLKPNINFKCIEIDVDMVNLLIDQYPNIEKKIIHQNVLKADFEQIFQKEKFTLIGNFPYNISSQIVFQAIKFNTTVDLVIGMFQKEMAERIISKHGSKEYGIISILTQAYFDCAKIMDIAPGSFMPPPKVNSMVIKLIRKPNFELPVPHKDFVKVVKQSFSMRRKMLRNNLKPIIKNREVIQDIYFNKRPEDLSVFEFIELTEKLIPHLNT